MTRVDRYHRARTRFDRNLARVRGAFDGAWLGLLDAADLDEVSARFHGSGSECLHREHNEGGLFRWEELAVRRHFADAGLVAVLAAGAGREVLGLSDLGIAAIGYEPNPALRRVGDGLLGGRGALYPAAPDTVPGLDDATDAAIVGWGAYSLIHPAETRVRFLADLARQLPPDAPVLVSFMVRHSCEAYCGAAHRVATMVRRVRRRPLPERGDALQPNLTHLFTMPEAVAEVTRAGLVVRDHGSHDYGWIVAGTAPSRRPAVARPSLVSVTTTLGSHPS